MNIHYLLDARSRLENEVTKELVTEKIHDIRELVKEDLLDSINKGIDASLSMSIYLRTCINCAHDLIYLPSLLNWLKADAERTGYIGEDKPSFRNSQKIHEIIHSLWLAKGENVLQPLKGLANDIITREIWKEYKDKN